MGIFHFKLEPLYEYRERLEELSKKEFNEAMRKLDEEEEKLSVLKEVYRKSSSDIDEMKEKDAAIPELNLFYAYLTGLKMHVEGQEKIIGSLREELEAKRGQLIEASKKKKVMEIMKEKSHDAYMEKLNKEDQKITDDLVNSRFKRKEDE